MAIKKPIYVKIRDTADIIFEGNVDRISSFNEVGPFDVYPMHANFISIINRKLALYNLNKKIKELKIEQAIIKVKQDQVHIYLGIEALLVKEEEDMLSPELKS
jgi:F0F1-type ATP synthase epsilon subunit